MTLRRNHLVWSLSCVLAALLAVPPELLAQASTPAQAAAASNNAPQDKWPRQIAGADGNTVNLYAPQLDSWDGRTIEWHAAVSIQAPGAKEPTFGVMFCSAKTDVDKTTRMVTLTDLKVTKVSFP
ncbi:MAG TPA: hypothetical protein VKG23_08720, partial [Thermoanaerobaculia bacterium]|nr:hypothetical protein [Thermoanaerobaculia bacterium]